MKHQSTQTRLKEHLNYDSLTGILSWVDPVRTNIFVQRKSRGYIFSLEGQKARAHGVTRTIFLWMTGEMPPSYGVEIDHRDGNPENNRWANLRLATRTENARNQKRNSRNSTGFKGVWRYGPRFAACIKIDGRTIHIGTDYDTPEEAHEAYKIAAATHFGEFARFE